MVPDKLRWGFVAKPTWNEFLPGSSLDNGLWLGDSSRWWPVVDLSSFKRELPTIPTYELYRFLESHFEVFRYFVTFELCIWCWTSWPWVLIHLSNFWYFHFMFFVLTLTGVLTRCWKLLFYRLNYDQFGCLFASTPYVTFCREVNKSFNVRLIR